ncbi:MAG: WD40 repeat protein [Planctomycetota bacterium]|jgi:WD40 repeat protein
MKVNPMIPLVGCLALIAPVFGQEVEPEPVSFHREVRPLLQEHCQGCHQPAKDSGDVMLLTHANLFSEIDGVPLVVPGHPGESLLIDVVSPLGALAPAMPEDAAPLSEGDRALLSRWIAEGALDDSPTSLGEVPTPDNPPLYPALPVIRALAFSPDGSSLAVSGRHEVLVHDVPALATGPPSPPRRLIGISSRIESLRFSPDGTILAAAGGTPSLFGEVQLWRPHESKLLLSISVTYDTLHGLSWSPNGELFAVGGSDHSLRAFDPKSGQQVLFQGAHNGWVLGSTFSHDGTHLISVGADRSAKLTKVDTEQFIDNITSITPGALKGGLAAVELHPKEKQVLLGGADGEPKLYRIFREKDRQIGDDFNLVRAYAPLLGHVTDVGWASDGESFFASASLSIQAGSVRGGAVRAYATQGEVLWTSQFGEAIYALAVDPTGAYVAVAGFDGAVRLLDPASGQTLLEFEPVELQTLAPTAPRNADTPAPAGLPSTAENSSATGQGLDISTEGEQS